MIAVGLALSSYGAVGATAAADDCVVAGVIDNARISGLGEGGVCSGRGPLGEYPPKHWWLPQRGSEIYGLMISGVGMWGINVSAPYEALPQSLSCGAAVSLNGVRLTSSQPVDMSWPGGFPLMPDAKRTSATGVAEPDISAVESALASPHSGTASFSVECGEVGSARWTMPYTVVPKSPPGREPGVSINDGADFTNDPDVRLHLGWKSWPIDKVKISNDGGFAPSKTRVFDLTSADPITWRLVVLGSERLPKTVYVRYHNPSRGGGWEPLTYTDDIVLDTVKPEIVSASLGGSREASLAAKGRTLRVKAKDNRSGIKSMQVSKGKPHKKAKVIKYRKTVPVPGSGRLFVRVKDGAGNWSKWK